MSDIEELERLHRLHQRGALSDDEFRAEKTKLLGAIDQIGGANRRLPGPRRILLFSGLALVTIFAVLGAAWLLIASRHDALPSVRAKASAPLKYGTQTAAMTANASSTPVGQSENKKIVRPLITAAWLAGGAWVDVPENPRLACDTEGVTFSRDGQYSDGAGYGKFRTDGSHITYFNRVLRDEEGDDDTEDRSKFNNPMTTKVSWIGPNQFRENGAILYRCNDD